MKTDHEKARFQRLMWAYLTYHEKLNPVGSLLSWVYLLEWSSLGGKTADVPRSFGGTA